MANIDDQIRGRGEQPRDERGRFISWSQLKTEAISSNSAIDQLNRTLARTNELASRLASSWQINTRESEKHSKTIMGLNTAYVKLAAGIGIVALAARSFFSALEKQSRPVIELTLNHVESVKRLRLEFESLYKGRYEFSKFAGMMNEFQKIGPIQLFSTSRNPDTVAGLTRLQGELGRALGAEMGGSLALELAKSFSSNSRQWDAFISDVLKRGPEMALLSAAQTGGTDRVIAITRALNALEIATQVSNKSADKELSAALKSNEVMERLGSIGEQLVNTISQQLLPTIQLVADRLPGLIAKVENMSPSDARNTALGVGAGYLGLRYLLPWSMRWLWGSGAAGMGAAGAAGATGAGATAAGATAAGTAAGAAGTAAGIGAGTAAVGGGIFGISLGLAAHQTWKALTNRVNETIGGRFASLLGGYSFDGNKDFGMDMSPQGIRARQDRHRHPVITEPVAPRMAAQMQQIGELIQGYKQLDAIQAKIVAREEMQPKLNLAEAVSTRAEAIQRLEASMFGASFSPASILTVNKALENQIKLLTQERDLIIGENEQANMERVQKETQILQLREKQVSNLHQMRTAYLGVLTAQATQAGAFSKIIINENQNLQAGLERANIRANNALGQVWQPRFKDQQGNWHMEKQPAGLNSYQMTGNLQNDLSALAERQRHHASNMAPPNNEVGLEALEYAARAILSFVKDAGKDENAGNGRIRSGTVSNPGHGIGIR